MIGTVLLSAVLAAGAPQLPEPVQSDTVFQALRDEMQRSLSRLTLEDNPPPYFVGYVVEDAINYQLSASFGAVTGEGETRRRILIVDVRVGSPQSDQTVFVSDVPAPGMIWNYLPLEDDYDAIRNIAWRLTDRAYKEAIEVFSHKQAVLKSKTEEEGEPLADFSEQKPTVLVRTGGRPASGAHALRSLALDVSKSFRKHPRIHGSNVYLSGASVVRSFIDSDGNIHRLPTSSIELRVDAYALAGDGSPQGDMEIFLGRTADTFPSEKVVRGRVDAMAKRLEERLSAPRVDTYQGPVLIEGQAAATLWWYFMRQHAVSPRQPLFEHPWMETMLPTHRFRNKIGRRVTNGGIAIVDDPTLKEWDGRPLLGHYDLDEQGVSAQKVTIVEDDRLQGFLSDRTPGENNPRSNGHALGGGLTARPHARPAVILVTTEDPIEAEELWEEFSGLLEDEGLEYGLVIETLSPHPSVTSFQYQQMLSSGINPSEIPDPIRVSRIRVSDGTREPVRDLRFVSVDAGALRDIVAVGDDPTLHEFIDMGGIVPRLSRGQEGTSDLSVITPSLLFEELELQGQQAEGQRLPLLPHPHFEEPAAPEQ